MKCLNIRSTNIMLGMNTQPGRLDIDYNHAKLHTEYEAPRAGIWPELAKVDIDQYPSRRAYGCKTAADSLRDYAAAGRRQVLQYIEKKAQMSTTLVKNAAKYNVYAAEARQQIKPPSEMLIGLVTVPRPVITVTPGRMQGEIDTGTYKTTATPQPVQMEYTPAKVESYVRQRNSLRMWVTDSQYDIYA